MASAGTGWPGYVAILWGGPEEQEKRNGRINSQKCWPELRGYITVHSFWKAKLPEGKI